MIGILVAVALLAQEPDYSKPPVPDQLPITPDGVELETRNLRYFIGGKYQIIPETGYWKENGLYPGSREWVRARARTKADGKAGQLNEGPRNPRTGDRLVVLSPEGATVVSCLDFDTLRLLKASKDPTADMERMKDQVVTFAPYTTQAPVVQGVEYLAAAGGDVAKVRILTGPDSGKTVFLTSKYLHTPGASAKIIGDLEAKERKESIARLAEIKGEIEAAKKAARVKSGTVDISIRKKVYDREFGKLIEAVGEKYKLPKDALAYIDQRSAEQIEKEIETLPKDGEGTAATGGGVASGASKSSGSSGMVHVRSYMRNGKRVKGYDRRK